MPNFFFTDTSGTKRGPLTPQQLKAMAMQGLITPNTPLETDGGHKGLAGQLSGLFNAPASQPAVPTVSQTAPQSVRVPIATEIGGSSRTVTTIGIVAVVLVAGVGLAMIVATNSRSKSTAVHSQNSVIPTQAGTQTNDMNPVSLAPRLRGGDGEREAVGDSVADEKSNVAVQQPAVQQPVAAQPAQRPTPQPATVQPPAPQPAQDLSRLSPEQRSRLSPQQQETVAYLAELFMARGEEQRADLEQLRNRTPAVNTTITQSRTRMVENTTRRIQQIESVSDPVLVGKHVLFSPEWLALLGDGRNNTITRQQFQAYRDRVDRLYEIYENFVGHKSADSDKIFIDLAGDEIFGKNGVFADLPGGAAGGEDAIYLVYINKNHIDMRMNRPGFERNAILSNNLVGGVMMHEIAHLFTFPDFVSQRWDPACREAAADLLVYCAVEHYGFSAISGGSFSERGQIQVITTSSVEPRQTHVQTLLRNLRFGNLSPFRGGPGDWHANYGRNAHCLYTFGLVDVVGWGTFGKAIQSYHNGTYAPTKTYTPDSTKSQTGANAVAHEFFDRLAHFHDLARQDPVLAWSIPLAGRNLTGAQALRSLPDSGRLLDEHFTVPTTPIAQPAVRP